jgi:hypothetical protein
MIVLVCVFLKIIYNSWCYLNVYVHIFITNVFPDIVGTVVAIGKIVALTNSGGPKLRRTIVVEDAE